MRQVSGNFKIISLLIIIFLLALLIRGAYVYSEFKYDFSSTAVEQADYQDLAIHLLHGEYYSQYSPEKINTNRNPGYPFLLAIVYGLFYSFWPIALINIILSAAIPVLAYFLARLYFSERVSLLAAVFAVLYPAYLFYSDFCLTEIPFSFLFILCWLCFSKFLFSGKMRFLIASAVLQAICIYFRGECFFFTCVMLGILLLYNNGKISISKLSSSFAWKNALIFGIIVFLAVLPWGLRQYGLGVGILPVESVGGYNGLWATSRYGLMPEGMIVPAWHAKFDNLTTLEKRKIAFEDFKGAILSNPSGYLTGVFSNARILLIEGHNLASTRLSRLTFHSAIASHSYFLAGIKLFSYGYAVFFNVIGAIGAIFLFGKGRAWLLSVPFFYKFIMHSLIHGESRYLIPVMPMLLIFASALFFYFFSAYHKPRGKPAQSAPAKSL